MSSSSNQSVNNQRNGGRSQVLMNDGKSSSIAHVYQAPTSSTSVFNHNNNNQRIPPPLTSHNHTKNQHSQHQSPHSRSQQYNRTTPQDINYLSKLSLRDHGSSMSVALHKLSQHYTVQQANSQMMHRTNSTSAISSVQANPLDNFQIANATDSCNKTDGALKSKTITAPARPQQLLQAAAHNGSASLNRLQKHNRSSQLNDHMDQDNEDTTIKEDEFENDLEASKKSHSETIGSLESNLPIELSFLIRQQAYCMARMNYLDRQIKELQETSQKSQQHHHHYHQPHHIDPTASQMSPGSVTMNQRLHNHLNHHLQQQHQLYQQQRILNADGQTVTATTTKNGNFILSDDSGGEYSRATISDDDELSSLLDQIAKSVRPDQPPASASSIAHHHHQAVPIFVMGSPIVPFGFQYYDEMNATNVPATAATMPQYIHHNRPQQLQHPILHRPQQVRRSSQHSQHFDRSISAVEQIVSQRERNQINEHLNAADNWLKMRSKTAFNGGGDSGNNGDGKDGH